MNTKAVITFVVVTLGVLLGVGGLLWQFGNSAEKPIADIAGDYRHVKGEGSVEIVEFSDLQCPACAGVQEPLKKILAKYEGKVKLVYRHFPLTNIHKNALAAAWVVEAANNQGKFWELHDTLFAKQAEWSELSNPRELFGQYAEELGMDKAKLLADMDAQASKDLVSADSLAATRYRLTGTPTFFVNGIRIEFNQLEAKLAELVK